MLQSITTPIRKICTEEIRSYLSGYQQINGCGKVTVDNIRRNISSFFSWLEEEDYILKSPMRRIHKIKTKQQTLDRSHKEQPHWEAGKIKIRENQIQYNSYNRVKLETSKSKTGAARQLQVCMRWWNVC